MMKSGTRLKPIAPRPDGSLPLGASGSAFAGQHLGVACSPLEGMVSMDPKDYVWGVPTIVPRQYTCDAYQQPGYGAASAVPGYSAVQHMHHSVSLPSMYPVVPGVQGCNIVPQHTPHTSRGMEHVVPMEQLAGSTATTQAMEMESQGLEELDDVPDLLKMPLQLDGFLEGNDMDHLADTTGLSRADSWRMGNSDLPSDLSTVTGDVKTSLALQMLGEEGPDGGHLGAVSGNVLEPSPGPAASPDLLREGVNFDSLAFLDHLPEMEETSSLMAPGGPTGSPPRRGTNKKGASGNLKRAKSEAVLKKPPRSPNLLCQLPPGDAFTTILDYLNGSELFPGNERQAAISAICAMQQSLQQGRGKGRTTPEAPVAGGSGSGCGSGPSLLRTKSEIPVPRGRRSRSLRPSPSTAQLPSPIAMDICELRSPIAVDA